MLKNNKIAYLLAFTLFAITSQNCLAAGTSSNNYNPTPMPSSGSEVLPANLEPIPIINAPIQVNHNAVVQPKSTVSQYPKLQDAMQSLDGAKANLDRDMIKVQIQLEESKKKVQDAKLEQHQVQDHLYFVKNQIKTLNSAKKKIQKDMEIIDKYNATSIQN